jgi:hypothetical protein
MAGVLKLQQTAIDGMHDKSCKKEFSIQIAARYSFFSLLHPEG